MAPAKTDDSAKGKVLTNDKGMTLCVIDKDSGGATMGSKQWAYKDRPLHTWKNDKARGPDHHFAFCNSSGNFATFTAIRRAGPAAFRPSSLAPI